MEVDKELDFENYVSNLTGMGYPEDKVRLCLQAANGNPDIALQELQKQIPAAKAPALTKAPATGFLGGLSATVNAAAAGGSSLMAAVARGGTAKDSFTQQNEENRRLSSPVVSRTVNSKEVKEGLLKSKETRSKNKRQAVVNKKRFGHAATTGRTDQLPHPVTADNDEFGNMSDNTFESDNSDGEFNKNLEELQKELQHDATFNPDGSL